MERCILLKGLYCITSQYNRFHCITEFIGIYERIHSFVCIFKNFGNVQLIWMLREKKYFKFFVNFLRCTKNEESWNSEMFSIHEGLKCACFPKIRLKISWLSENKWRHIHKNPQMSFPAEASPKPYFGEMNFAERFLLYNTII